MFNRKIKYVNDKVVYEGWAEEEKPQKGFKKAWRNAYSELKMTVFKESKRLEISKKV